MAIEVIRQILAPNNAPNINGVRAEARVSTALLESFYQGLVETNNKGISDRFATESEINDSVQIFVNRVLPAKMKPREQGAGKNGGSFSNEGHYTQTETVGIELLTTVDDVIIIPRARQDTIKVDLLATQVDLYAKRLNTIINGMTAAAHIFTPWLEDSKGNEIHKVDVSADDITNKNVLVRIMEANDLLDEGDSDHDIDVFPTDTRIAVFKAGSRAILKAAGVLVIGGSNYAQDIVKGGAISHGDSTAIPENGYMGDIDGVPCHMISNESLKHAAGFLGLTPTDLSKGSFWGYIASSYAAARGVTTLDRVKIVDTRGGQGLELQPYTRMGAVSWYAKGQVLITKADFEVSGSDVKHGLYDYVKGFFPTQINAGQITFKLKAEGSRYYATVASISATGTALTVNATAKDDAGVEHAVAGHYVIADAPIKTVYEFCKAAYADNATNDSLDTLAGATSGTYASGKYVTVLVVADDGSCTLASTVVA